MTPRNWIKRLRAGADDTVALVCLPYAGAGANIFASWVHWLPEHLSLYALDLPGRGAAVREAPCSDMDAVVDRIHGELQSLGLQEYVVFGHSLGALIASRIIVRQHAKGDQLPLCFVASGCRAPQLPYRRQGMVELDDVAFARALVDMGNAGPLDHRLFELCKPALRADFTLAEAVAEIPDYPVRDVKLVVLRGMQDEVVRPQDTLGWTHLFNEVAWHDFETDHFFIHREEDRFRAILTETLISAIERAEISSKPASRQLEGASR